MKNSSIMRLSQEYTDAQIERRQKHLDKLDSLKRMLDEIEKSVRKRVIDDMQTFAALFNNLIQEEQDAIVEIDATLASEEEE